MSGTWEKQNKVIPGAYINVRTNEPLRITPGERGTVMMLMEMSVGTDGQIYNVTAQESDLPAAATAEDKKLITEALKKAKTIKVYKLPATHTQENVEAALKVIRTEKWDVLCYPYDRKGDDAVKGIIATFVKTMTDDEGVKIQAVLANYAGDYEGIINVVQGIVLSGNEKLTASQTTAWVAGATAGATMYTSNTGMLYEGAVDVDPRMTKTEMETAIKAGKFIFKVDSSQNVTVVYDINSLTTVTTDKGQIFTKNRLIRTIYGIANDVASIFESNFIGKTNNNEEGRSLLKAALVDYFNTLQTLGAIQDFETDDITISEGDAIDAVVVTIAIQPVDSIEKIYITVNLS